MLMPEKLALRVEVTEVLLEDFVGAVFLSPQLEPTAVNTRANEEEEEEEEEEEGEAPRPRPVRPPRPLAAPFPAPLAAPFPVPLAAPSSASPHPVRRSR